MISASLSKSSDEQGFGFIGMVAAILVLSVGVALVVVVMAPSFSTSRNTATVEKASLLRVALTRYYNHHQTTAFVGYPASLDHLVTTDAGVACYLDNTVASASYLKLQGWCGPYIDIEFAEDAAGFKTDGWGSEFVHAAGTLTSYGPNRVAGGGDDLVFSP